MWLKHALLTLFLILHCGVLCHAAGKDSQPNILLIAVDDLNHWVGYFGRNPQIKTPHLDRLSNQGVSFTHHYCSAPACNPSRASMLSGLRPSSSGVYENHQDWRPHLPKSQTLIGTFRQAGYKTLGAGKIYHGAHDRTEEWEDYLPSDAYKSKVVSQNALSKHKNFTDVNGIKFGATVSQDDEIADYHYVNYGIEQLHKQHDRPFLLTIGIQKPHLPWCIPQKYFDLYPLDQIQLPPHQEDDLIDLPEAAIKMAKPKEDHAAILHANQWKQAIQAYMATISYADAQIGRLLDALENSAYKDNTVVVLWSDHGWHLGEKEHWRKFALWLEATRAPLIIKAPGLTPANKICDRPIDATALFPTLVELTHIAGPTNLDGQSIVSLLKDPGANWKSVAVTTHQLGNHSIRDGAWSYITYKGGGEELYHLKNDPYEWTNLASRPEFEAEKQRLRKHLPKVNHPNVPSRKALKNTDF